MNWFEIVSKRHKEYLNIVRSFAENKDNKYVEDIVQDAYLEITELGAKKHKENDKRVNDKYKDLSISERILNEDNEVNMMYMWITLKRV
jgi:predicted nucleic acid-binding protein